MVDLHDQFEFATFKWRKIACGKLKWTLMFAKEWDKLQRQMGNCVWGFQVA